jgi:hypothetical protein
MTAGVFFVTENADMLKVTEPQRPAIANAEPPSIGSEPELAVFVLFTSIDWTLKALEQAREIAQALGTEIEVVVVQAVPFPLPLDTPLVPMEHIVRHLVKKIAGLPYQSKTEVSLYLCRDPIVALKRILNPICPVVICGRERWWPTRSQRLARKLRRKGYDVVFVKME